MEAQEINARIDRLRAEREHTATRLRAIEDEIVELSLQLKGAGDSLIAFAEGKGWNVTMSTDAGENGATRVTVIAEADRERKSKEYDTPEAACAIINKIMRERQSK